MSIYKYTQEQIDNYPSKEIDIDGKSFNQYETLRKVSAYTQSKYLSGKYDALGRRKPFYNINGRLLNKQRAAEDIDTKDIQILTTRPDHYAKSLLMSVANKKWMKLVNFPLTLNKMTKNRGEHGGVLVKKVFKDGILDIDVVDLNKVITDPVDIESGVKIDPQTYNVAELIEMKSAGWENVEEAIEMQKNYSGSNGDYGTGYDTYDATVEYVTVYVVDGVLPRTYIDEEADDYEYSHQTHIITLVNTGGEDLDTNGVTLYKTERKENIYKYLPYEALGQRSLGRGVVEKSFEAQESINEAKINERNAMEIAGKAIFQQVSGNSDARNIWTDIVDGDILEYNKAPASILQSTPSSLGYNQNIVQDWNTQINNEMSVLDSNTGNMPASATFRGQALQNQNADAPFELKREEMGIFLQQIYRDWVIPFLKKWVSTQEFIELELPTEQMEQVINDYAYNVGLMKAQDNYFSGKYDDAQPGTKFQVMALDAEQEAQEIKSNLRSQGKNWIKSGSDYLKGIEFDLDILITDEQINKQVFLQNQVDALNSYLANIQTIQQDPNARKQMDSILNTMGQPKLEVLDNVAQEGQTIDIQAAEVE